VFKNITTKHKLGTLLKIVHLEASIKPHIYNIIHDILITMTFTMACLKLWKALEMDFGFLKINIIAWKITFFLSR
jgi:hypothetical protein